MDRDFRTQGHSNRDVVTVTDCGFLFVTEDLQEFRFLLLYERLPTPNRVPSLRRSSRSIQTTYTPYYCLFQEEERDERNNPELTNNFNSETGTRTEEPECSF